MPLVTRGPIREMMSVPVYFPCALVQNLMKKLIVDTKQYHSQQYGSKTVCKFKLNFGHNVMQVVPLHHYPEYADQCCDLVNAEWKRSRTARMRSLESSCDALPTSLILVQGHSVIGHSKLSVIPSMHDACFLESVVIDKELRGRGYGKFLMRRIEEHCLALGLKAIFLSTKDKVEFYEKLGYEECAPVSIYGHGQRTCWPAKGAPSTPRCAKFAVLSPPPPPPPLPPPLDFCMGQANKHKVYMSKTLRR